MITLLTEPALFDARELRVEGESYQHLFRARRVAVGEEMRIVDGRGRARWGKVARVDRTSATVALGEPAPAHEPALHLELLVPTCRPERASWLIEKATEVGVAGIRFLNMARAPRDIGSGDPAGNPLGGTEYFGASLETQFPIWGIPRDLGLKGALFADAGTLFGYHGQTNFQNGGALTSYYAYPNYGQGNTITVGGDTTKIRSSVGASIIWQSPLGPIRFDFAKAITKDANDQTQFFRFSGGATF